MGVYKWGKYYNDSISHQNGGPKNTHISAKDMKDFLPISSLGYLAQFHIDTVLLYYQMGMEI